MEREKTLPGASREIVSEFYTWAETPEEAEMVFAELEPYADAILAEFGVQQEAVLTLVSGKARPEGCLPVQMPADMKTVELHCEDRPFDLEPYVDSDGNVYDYGFGLNG